MTIMTFEKIEKIVDEDLLGAGSKLMTLARLRKTLYNQHVPILMEYLKNISIDKKLDILCEKDGAFINQAPYIILTNLLPNTHEKYKELYFKLTVKQRKLLNSKIFNNDAKKDTVVYNLLNCIFNDKIIKDPSLITLGNAYVSDNIIEVMRGNIYSIFNYRTDDEDDVPELIIDFMKYINNNELVKDIFTNIKHDGITFWSVNEYSVPLLNNKKIIELLKYYNKNIDINGDFIYKVFINLTKDDNKIKFYNKILDIFGDDLNISNTKKKEIEKIIMNMTL